MSLNKFITSILNIDSNIIDTIIPIDSTDESLSFFIKLKHNSNTKCKLCNNSVIIHGYYKRLLTHSTFANRKCSIIYNQRRYKCKSCNFTFHENNPFINTSESITLETKINILKDLKYSTSTFTNVANRYNVSVTKVINIFDKHVNINRKKLPYILSIDEHYLPNSNFDSLYCAILLDFDSGTIIDILPDRKKDYLSNYFNNIKISSFNHFNKSSEFDNVKFVSIDLYEPYRDIAKTYFPKAIICADSFHVIKNINNKFRNIRIKCRNSTDNITIKYLITKFKFIFNNNINLDNNKKYNKTLKKFVNYRDIFNILTTYFPILKTAYDLK